MDKDSKHPDPGEEIKDEQHRVEKEIASNQDSSQQLNLGIPNADASEKDFTDLHFDKSSMPGTSRKILTKSKSKQKGSDIQYCPYNLVRKKECEKALDLSKQQDPAPPVSVTDADIREYFPSFFVRKKECEKALDLSKQKDSAPTITITDAEIRDPEDETKTSYKRTMISSEETIEKSSESTKMPSLECEMSTITNPESSENAKMPSLECEMSTITNPESSESAKMPSLECEMSTLTIPESTDSRRKNRKRKSNEKDGEDVKDLVGTTKRSEILTDFKEGKSKEENISDTEDRGYEKKPRKSEEQEKRSTEESVTEIEKAPIKLTFTPIPEIDVNKFYAIKKNLNTLLTQKIRRRRSEMLDETIRPQISSRIEQESGRSTILDQAKPSTSVENTVPSEDQPNPEKMLDQTLSSQVSSTIEQESGRSTILDQAKPSTSVEENTIPSEDQPNSEKMSKALADAKGKVQRLNTYKFLKLSKNEDQIFDEEKLKTIMVMMGNFILYQVKTFFQKHLTNKNEPSSILSNATKLDNALARINTIVLEIPKLHLKEEIPGGIPKPPLKEEISGGVKNLQDVMTRLMVGNTAIRGEAFDLNSIDATAVMTKYRSYVIRWVTMVDTSEDVQDDFYKKMEMLKNAVKEAMERIKEGIEFIKRLKNSEFLAKVAVMQRSHQIGEDITRPPHLGYGISETRLEKAKNAYLHVEPCTEEQHALHRSLSSSDSYSTHSESNDGLPPSNLESSLEITDYNNLFTKFISKGRNDRNIVDISQVKEIGKLNLDPNTSENQPPQSPSGSKDDQPSSTDIDFCKQLMKLIPFQATSNVEQSSGDRETRPFQSIPFMRTSDIHQSTTATSSQPFQLNQTGSIDKKQSTITTDSQVVEYIINLSKVDWGKADSRSEGLQSVMKDTMKRTDERKELDNRFKNFETFQKLVVMLRSRQKEEGKDIKGPPHVGNKISETRLEKAKSGYLHSILSTRGAHSLHRSLSLSESGSAHSKNNDSLPLSSLESSLEVREYTDFVTKFIPKGRNDQNTMDKSPVKASSTDVDFCKQLIKLIPIQATRNVEQSSGRAGQSVQPFPLMQTGSINRDIQQNKTNVNTQSFQLKLMTGTINYSQSLLNRYPELYQLLKKLTKTDTNSHSQTSSEFQECDPSINVTRSKDESRIETKISSATDNSKSLDLNLPAHSQYTEPGEKKTVINQPESKPADELEEASSCIIFSGNPVASTPIKKPQGEEHRESIDNEELEENREFIDNEELEENRELIDNEELEEHREFIDNEELEEPREFIDNEELDDDETDEYCFSSDTSEYDPIICDKSMELDEMHDQLWLIAHEIEEFAKSLKDLLSETQTAIQNFADSRKNIQLHTHAFIRQPIPGLVKKT